MGDLKEILAEYQGQKIALYGLGTETERFLSEMGDAVSVAGLLDGFREDWEIYGYPIISLKETLSKRVRLIIAVARPGSCKVIARRVGAFCRENGIALYDVRGRGLLENRAVSYDFKQLGGKTRLELLEKIGWADVVSFDLFDTLVMRKVRSYTDIFGLMDLRLQKGGVYIPDFVKLRLWAEKELSRDKAPGLVEIYKYVLKKTGGNFVDAPELAAMEWEIDLSVIAVRSHMRDIFCKAAAAGKQVVVTTDSYYSLGQIKTILSRFGLTGYDNILVSFEYGISKTQGLFKALK